LAATKEVLGLASGPFEDLFQGVKINEKRENIIDYYNKLFVPAIKQYLKQLRLSSRYHDLNTALTLASCLTARE
jgi:hypothetical protein